MEWKDVECGRRNCAMLWDCGKQCDCAMLCIAVLHRHKAVQSNQSRSSMITMLCKAVHTASNQCKAESEESHIPTVFDRIKGLGWF